MATDTDAIEPAKLFLERSGWTNISQINHPVDFTATLDDVDYFVELKYTTSHDKAFGNVTMTEWICAMDNPENFRFLIANKPGGINSNSEWNFFFIAPTNLLDFSHVSPFKVNFSLPLAEPRTPPNRRPTTIVPTFGVLREIQNFYETLRPDEKE